MSRLRDLLRDARYALPQKIERLPLGAGAEAAIRRCMKLKQDEIDTTVGYFQARDATPDQILSANLELLNSWKASKNSYLSVKAPPMHFDRELLYRLAEAAGKSAMPLLFDAHAPKDAEATLAAVDALADEFPETGFALPARWRRSQADAIRFRDTPARIRIVKGEWPDPGFSQDVEAAYLSLAARLAGRRGTVAVATHDPALAEHALERLLAAGTPCELEQLRALPGRRTQAVARRLGVPIRIYVPFGPGWWPYALDKALGRRYLLAWLVRDWVGARAAGSQRRDALEGAASR